MLQSPTRKKCLSGTPEIHRAFGTFLFDKRYPAKFRFHPSLLQTILPAEVPFLFSNTLPIGAALWQSREAQSARLLSRECL